MKWSPLAISRLTEIAEYIALDDPAAAARWVDKMFVLVEGLSDSPERGRRVPEIGSKLIREIISGNYRIIYKQENGEVLVLTVRHVKQAMSLF